jgi:hypothetical protein
VILDHLSTHSKKGGTWLARHPPAHFHFTPANASWLDQIEVWFSILAVRLLRNGSFTSAQELRDAMDRDLNQATLCCFTRLGIGPPMQQRKALLVFPQHVLTQLDQTNEKLVAQRLPFFDAPTLGLSGCLGIQRFDQLVGERWIDVMRPVLDCCRVELAQRGD